MASPPTGTDGTTCHVSQYCLRGTAGQPGALLYTGAARRETLSAESPVFKITPHGQGTLELLQARPALLRWPATAAPAGLSSPGGRPLRRTASSISDDESDGVTTTYVAASFTGSFSNGHKSGWGVLGRTWFRQAPRNGGGVVVATRTLRCAWDGDVPQLLSDPSPTRRSSWPLLGRGAAASASSRRTAA